jgi:uncharacterized small protein (TIGR04563 family)
MPYYVRNTCIDWHYEQAGADLQPLLREADKQLSSRDHTRETFTEQLSKVAAQRPELVADALIEDGFRFYWLVRALRGEIAETEVDERPEGALDQRVELPLDEVATVKLARHGAGIRAVLRRLGLPAGESDDVVELPLEYDDEGSMRDLFARVARAVDEGDHRFVAEVGLTRFLVELGPGVATVRRLVFVTEPALVDRLLRREFTVVPAPPPRAGEKREQPIYWPEAMLRTIQEEAVRLDRSLSYVVQSAWKAAGNQVATSEHAELSLLIAEFQGDKRKQTLFFPAEMLQEIADQARRLDASLSFVVQCAWMLARPDLARLTPSSDDE